MAISLECPTCAAKLKLLEAPDAGQRVECPKCGLTFLPHEDETQRRPSKAKPERFEDDDRPRSSRRSRDDDDEETPRQHKPVSRRPRDDDDDDEAPRQRKPVSRRPRDDDDYRDHSAQKRQGLLIGLAVGVGLFFIVAIVGGAVYFLQRDNGKVQPEVAATRPLENNGGGGNAPGNGDVARAEGAGQPTTGVAPPVRQDPPVAPPVRQDVPAPVVSKNPDLPAELEEKIRKATVFVHVSFSQEKQYSGSGFIVRSNEDVAYIVTNHHVIAGESEEKPAAENPPNNGPGRPGIGRPPGFPMRPPIFPGIPGFPGRPGFGPPGKNNKPEPQAESREINVEFFRGTPQLQTYHAEVVAEDPEYDLAVLRVTGRNFPAAISLADEAGIAETMPVRIFGFPLARNDLLMSKGVVSQLRRNTQGEISDVQINADLNHGSSGGPVVDTSGKLVGVTVAGVQGKNLAWAVPTTHLQHMFRGAVNGGLLGKLRRQGAGIGITGEVWRFDRKNRVEERRVVDAMLEKNAPNQSVPSDEFLAIAFLSDPMHKIASAKVLYAENKPGTILKDGAGWAPIRNAQSLPLTLRDRTGQATIKMPADTPDEVYAIQFTYVNGDGKTMCMEPHLVRFTFPKSIKQVTLNITGITDDPTKRYVADSVRKLIPNVAINSTHTPTGLNVVIDPVDDPQSLADKIDFGTAKVTGWTISVAAKKIDLPPPTEQEVEQALKDLKSTDGRAQQAAADRMAKCYTVLPSRRAEVAKALETIVAESTKGKDNPWVLRG
ncbi:MAG TPA: serine protease, partial [Gemmata sp.]|nr:serine protease [Gemmata sp.]